MSQPNIGVVRRAVGSVQFTPVESAAIEWRYRDQLRLGSFRDALWTAIENADDSNLAKLEAGFSCEVQAVRRWRGERGFAEYVLDRLEQFAAITAV